MVIHGEAGVFYSYRCLGAYNGEHMIRFVCVRFFPSLLYFGERVERDSHCLNRERERERERVEQYQKCKIYPSLV